MPELADPAAAVEQFDCPTCEVPAGPAAVPQSGALPPLQDGTSYRDQFGRFTTRYPAISVELMLSDRMVDLIDDGCKLAGQPTM